MEYISNSQIKSFMDCEARALAELRGEYERPKSDALLEGSLLDVLLTGTEEEFREFLNNHPDIVSNRGETKGQLKKKFQQIIDAGKRAMSDDLFKKMMCGKNQVIYVGELYGSKIKIKIDVLRDKSIVDLKSCESFGKKFYNTQEGRYETFIEHWKYVQQGAIYQEIVRQNLGTKLPFFLACVSKEEEPDIGVFFIDDDSMKESLESLADVIPHIQAIKDGKIEPIGCGHCAYCRKTKKLDKPISWLDIDFSE